jgi:general secretion pathway protein G
MNPEPAEPIVLDYATVKQTSRTGPSVLTSVLAACVAGGLFVAAATIPSQPHCYLEAKLDMARAAIGPNGPLSQAIKLYKADVGKYPSALADLYAQPHPSSGPGQWQGPDIKDPSGLLDPWGHPYQYCALGVHNKNGFDLWSFGPDRVAGTADDILGGGP